MTEPMSPIPHTPPASSMKGRVAPRGIHADAIASPTRPLANVTSDMKSSIEDLSLMSGGLDEEEGVHFVVQHSKSSSSDSSSEGSHNAARVMPEDEWQQHTPAHKAAEVAVQEPKTVKKIIYGAFFVPFGDSAEPKRAKPPTPSNHMPLHFRPPFIPDLKQNRQPSPPSKKVASSGLRHPVEKSRTVSPQTFGGRIRVNVAVRKPSPHRYRFEEPQKKAARAAIPSRGIRQDQADVLAGNHSNEAAVRTPPPLQRGRPTRPSQLVEQPSIHHDDEELPLANRRSRDVYYTATQPHNRLKQSQQSEVAPWPYSTSESHTPHSHSQPRPAAVADQAAAPQQRSIAGDDELHNVPYRRQSPCSQNSGGRHLYGDSARTPTVTHHLSARCRPQPYEVQPKSYAPSPQEATPPQKQRRGGAAYYHSGMVRTPRQASRAPPPPPGCATYRRASSHRLMQRTAPPTLEELDHRLRQLRCLEPDPMMDEMPTTMRTHYQNPTFVIKLDSAHGPQCCGRCRSRHTDLGRSALSPPWRTDHTARIKPPWNIRQPHSPLYHPSSARATTAIGGDTYDDDYD